MFYSLTITDYISRADDFASDERTPFASMPWNPESEVIFKEGNSTDPIVENGTVFGYFLEASIITELYEWPPAKMDAAFVERVISYAINDA